MCLDLLIANNSILQILHVGGFRIQLASLCGWEGTIPNRCEKKKKKIQDGRTNHKLKTMAAANEISMDASLALCSTRQRYAPGDIEAKRG